MVHFIPPSQRRLATLAAQSESAPVLICGGSGTGKGAIARWIHENGSRSIKPFVISHRDASLGSQLLLAHGGTFFITEMGEFPLADQRALLDFLKTHAVKGEAGSPPRLVNARIIAGTSQALENRARAGLFNAELLDKLNVFRLEMPRLAERRTEFEDIVLGLVGEIAHDTHRDHLRALSPDAWARLRAYEWPGNLREMRNVLRLAILSAAGDQIESGDLPEFGHHRVDFRATREQFERTYLAELLTTVKGDLGEAARITRLTREALAEKAQRYGLKVALPPPSGAPAKSEDQDA